LSIEVRINQSFDFAKLSRRLLQLAGATLSVIGWQYVKETQKSIERRRLFKSRTGNLFQSIQALPESETRIVIFGAGKDSHLEYGKFLEFGTEGPYVIRPKERKALSIPTSKGFIFRKKVTHPGIRARHYFFGDYEEKMKTAIEVGKIFFYNRLKEEFND